MKKTLTILLLFMIASNLLCSQENNGKTVFGVSAGCSVPYGEFADRTMGSYAGFAVPGMNMEVDLLRYTSRFFGLTSGLGYASVFFNEKAYQAEYDHILAGYGQNVVSAGNYQVLKGVLGFILKIPETRHTEALLLFDLGAALSVHPDLVVTNSKLGEINTVRKNGDWNLVGSLGLKINYWLTDKYGISLTYSLNSTRPDFRDETSIERIFFLPIKYMNINIGFVMNL